MTGRNLFRKDLSMLEDVLQQYLNVILHFRTVLQMFYSMFSS